MYLYIYPTDYYLFLRIMDLKKSNPLAWQKFLKLNHNPDRVQFTSLSPFHNEMNEELVGYLKVIKNTLGPREYGRFVRFCGTLDLVRKDNKESPVDLKEIEKVLDLMDWNSVDDETPNSEDVWAT